MTETQRKQDVPTLALAQAGVARLVGAPSCILKGQGFDTQSGLRE